jgi:hypothetical protein
MGENHCNLNTGRHVAYGSIYRNFNELFFMFKISKPAANLDVISTV